MFKSILTSISTISVLTLKTLLKNFGVFLVLLFVGFLLWFKNIESPRRADKICNLYPDKEYIDGIFYHDGIYTFFIPRENGVMFQRIIAPNAYLNYHVIFIKDVLMSDRNYISYTKKVINTECNLVVNIHISGFNSVFGTKYNDVKL